MTVVNGAVHAADPLALIGSPTLVVDRRRAQRNIARMAAKAQATRTRFRPHFKTHQSPAIGDWFRAAGVDAITVSSVAMAQTFADHGWRDITIAFPFNPRETMALRALGSRIRLGLIVDSEPAAQLLAESGIQADVWIDVDVGYHRTGVAFDDAATLVAIAERVRSAHATLRLVGVITHAGHTYEARSRSEVRRIHEESVDKVVLARSILTRAGIAAEISIGDTPGCSVAESFAGIDEIRPGNFVFYDLQQLQIGSCAEDDLALALACPVVGTYPERGAAVVHGGAVHLSKDSVLAADGTRSFGRVAHRESGSWALASADTYVSSVAQEHGTISAPSAFLDRLAPGSLVLVVPAHACLACDATRNFVALDGQPL